MPLVRWRNSSYPAPGHCEILPATQAELVPRVCVGGNATTGAWTGLDAVSRIWRQDENRQPFRPVSAHFEEILKIDEAVALK